MIDTVEAVLCEDGRTILFYEFLGETLISTKHEMLPISINEDNFLHREFAAAHKQLRDRGY